MRITGYLVAALLGIWGGWLLFAPTEETPPPEADTPRQASPPGRPWTPPPVPEPTWQQPAPSSYAPAIPTAPETFSYRPLSEREQQRLRAGTANPGEQSRYPTPAHAPRWTQPGYDYRPPERR